MRRLAFLATVLLGLAGCAVKEEGRECQAHSDCPTGQACGASGTCTRAAAACGDEGTRPLCKAGTQKCRGGRGGVPEECRADDRGEECASFQAKDTCGAHEVCGEAGGVAACGCDQTLPCWAAQQPYCEGTPGERVVCVQDADGCWFEESRAGCGSVRTCQPGTSGATCACPDTRCTPTDRAFCDPGGGIVTCLDVDGCSVEQSPGPCGQSQECTGPAGSAACTCVDDGGCGPGVPSLCDGQGKVIACITEPGNGCRHPDTQAVACSTVHQTCGAPANSPGSCQCVPDACADGKASFCDATGKLVACAVDAASCRFESPPATCDPGQTCVALPTAPASAECQCPAAGSIAGSGCTQGASPICGGSSVIECRQAPGSACFVWTATADCAASQLACDGGACICPAVTDGVYYADEAGGTPSPPPAGTPAPTGAANPASCRYGSIEVALAQANAVALGGGEVRATGASALAPMTFAVAGTLAIGPGVTVTTTDIPLGTASYTLQAPAGLGTQPFVALAAGASLSGFHVRNGDSTGPALETACVTGAAEPVLVDTVRISGAGSFSAGLSHASPDCPVTLRNAEVSGVGRGVDLLAGSLAVEGGAFSGNVTHVHADPGPTRTINLSVRNATLTHASDSAVVLNDVGVTSAVHLEGNAIARNQSTTSYLVSSTPAVTRRAGGLVLFASIPSTFFFRQNVFEGNGGDQVLVFVSGSVDLSGGVDSSACGTTANIMRCYDASPWVGLYATSGSVVVAPFNSWQNFPVSAGTRDFFGPVTGTNQSCSPVPATCP